MGAANQHGRFMRKNWAWSFGKSEKIQRTVELQIFHKVTDFKRGIIFLNLDVNTWFKDPSDDSNTFHDPKFNIELTVFNYIIFNLEWYTTEPHVWGKDPGIDRMLKAIDNMTPEELNKFFKTEEDDI